MSGTYSVYNIKVDNSLSFTPGATAGYVLAIDADGNTSWVPQTGGSGGGSGSAGTSGSSGTSGVDGTFYGSSGTSGTSGFSGAIQPQNYMTSKWTIGNDATIAGMVLTNTTDIGGNCYIDASTTYIEINYLDDASHDFSDLLTTAGGMIWIYGCDGSGNPIQPYIQFHIVGQGGLSNSQAFYLAFIRTEDGSPLNIGYGQPVFISLSPKSGNDGQNGQNGTSGNSIPGGYTNGDYTLNIGYTPGGIGSNTTNGLGQPTIDITTTQLQINRIDMNGVDWYDMMSVGTYPTTVYIYRANPLTGEYDQPYMIFEITSITYESYNTMFYYTVAYKYTLGSDTAFSINYPDSMRVIIMPGAAGANGTSGIDGTSGSSGSSGVDGTSGIDGSTGAPGADGTSGTSGITPAGSVGITIDGGGSAITTGVKGYIQSPYNGTIDSWTLIADQSGSVVIDVWKTDYTGAPPTVTNTITGSAKPTLSSAQKNTSSTLTGWNTSISAGDIIGFNIDSASTITRVNLAIKIIKS